MTEIVAWYLAIQLIGLAGLPLAWAWLRHLPSRGYAVAKALGLVLTGAIFWWGNVLRLWGNTTAAILTAAAILAALGLWRQRRSFDRAEVRAWWMAQWPFVLTVELLFVLAFAGWCAVRATQPQLETAGGEKWMEIAFLNAVRRAPVLPPHDPWLSGYAISYYYFGYVLVGMLNRLSAISTTIAFNLGGASWFALAAVGAYGIVYDLLASGQTGAERSDVTRPLLGPLLLLVTGNVEGLLEVFHANGWLPALFWKWLDIRNLDLPPQPPFTAIPQRFFWWWQASRVIQDYAPGGAALEVIDEFPAFSFTLGDMHPHVLALPFVLLVIALALNLYRRTLAAAPASNLRRSLRERLLPLLPYAPVLGALGFLNTWDFPIYWGLLVGALALGWCLRRAERATTPWAAILDAGLAVIPEALALLLLSLLAYAPFWWALRSQAGGVLPNLFNPTRLPQFAVMFAPLLLPVLALLGYAASTLVFGESEGRARGWLTLLLIPLAVVLGGGLVCGVIGAGVLAPYLATLRDGGAVMGISAPEIRAAILSRMLNPWTALLLAGGATVALAALFGKASLRPASYFPLLLALWGMLLTQIPEYIYLRDIFSTRMNTIFKFYFQAWVVWSLAGAWQIGQWLKPALSAEADVEAEAPSGVSITVRALLVGGSALLILTGLVYTGLAVPARAREHGVPWTLDSAAWLAEAHPQDYAAIRWLNDNLDGAAVILEAPGDIRRAYTYEGRVSALTGMPTVLGCADHQRQWRGDTPEPARRQADLETLFTSTDAQIKRDLLTQYQVAYIYIGPTELERYPAEGLQAFAAMFPAIYAADGVTIYRVQ